MERGDNSSTVTFKDLLLAKKAVLKTKLAK